MSQNKQNNENHVWFVFNADVGRLISSNEQGRDVRVEEEEEEEEEKVVVVVVVVMVMVDEE
jgi:hypothetical protein